MKGNEASARTTIPKGVRIGCLGLAVIVALLGVLALLNWREAARRDRPLDQPSLTSQEKAELAEVLRLKVTLGDSVWPGLGQARVPIILFNDSYEYLVGMSDPPAPWKVVEGDDFEGERYHRRAITSKPQAFAVPVGEEWAASIGTLELMNRSYLLGVREKLPFPLAELFPYFWATISPDLHVATILHEVFHAYQAQVSEPRLLMADSTHVYARAYPYGDASFADAWNREGKELNAALQAQDPATARAHVREFLRIRDERRQIARLGDDPLAFEREVEWEEGLAKYAEIRFHELAAEKLRGTAYTSYQPGLPHWQQEFGRLDGSLGREDGDYRFYLSGMAQARVLDRLAPDWKQRALGSGAYLDESLRAAAD